MNARWLLFSILLTIFLYFLPFAQLVTYPFLIFSTFVHENAHAIGAVLTGGSVDSLIVRMDGSGVTYTRGGLRFLISSAGYLGTAIFGAILLMLSAKQARVRPALVGLAVLVLLSTSIFVGHTSNLLVIGMIATISVLVAFSARSTASANGIRTRTLAVAFGILLLLIGYLIATKSLFSWSAALLIAISLLAVARFTSITFAHFFTTFLAVQCSLNALDAIKTVYFLSLRSSCGNDAAAMASLTGIPAWIWALLWAFLSIFILGISAILYTRKSIRLTPVPIG